MTYTDFKVMAFGDKSRQLRRGQYIFNVLFSVRPDLAEQVRASKLDPFYKDERIDDLMEWLSAHWTATPSNDDTSNAACERILELAGKATARPWFYNNYRETISQQDPKQQPTTGLKAIILLHPAVPTTLDDKCFIAAVANFAEPAAREIQRLREDINKLDSLASDWQSSFTKAEAQLACRDRALKLAMDALGDFLEQAQTLGASHPHLAAYVFHKPEHWLAARLALTAIRAELEARPASYWHNEAVKQPHRSLLPRREQQQTVGVAEMNDTERELAAALKERDEIEQKVRSSQTARIVELENQRNEWIKKYDAASADRDRLTEQLAETKAILAGVQRVNAAVAAELAEAKAQPETVRELRELDNNALRARVTELERERDKAIERGLCYTTPDEIASMRRKPKTYERDGQLKISWEDLAEHHAQQSESLRQSLTELAAKEQELREALQDLYNHCVDMGWLNEDSEGVKQINAALSTPPSTALAEHGAKLMEPLLRDKERLDWLEAHPGRLRSSNTAVRGDGQRMFYFGACVDDASETLRAAIDAAQGKAGA